LERTAFGVRSLSRYGAMQFAKKVVLHCPNGVPPRLHEVAGKFVAGGVKFVGAVGPKCDEVEEIIDEAAVLAGSPGRNFILTSSHPGESLQDAIDFAECLTGDYEGPVQVVELL
ncbi:hypothetical protein LNV23_23920, partial [Paucibacter sp. DJ1R-11]|uniref:DUF7684 family protein n=1 Tax=Paucibacter sp. DJ1R-11 TaxID=2893556 RepID=UPI0021E5020D